MAGVVLDQLEYVLIILRGFFAYWVTVLGGTLKYLLRLGQTFLDLLLEHGILLSKGVYASFRLIFELSVLLLHLRKLLLGGIQFFFRNLLGFLAHTQLSIELFELRCEPAAILRIRALGVHIYVY